MQGAHSRSDFIGAAAAQINQTPSDLFVQQDPPPAGRGRSPFDIYQLLNIISRLFLRILYVHLLKTKTTL